MAACGVAMLAAAAVVLPAEFGIDPLGAGDALGLTEIGLRKRAAADSGSADAVVQLGDGRYTADIALRPYGAREVKGIMPQGGEMTFSWSSDGAAVEFEFHGDPASQAADQPDYQSYGIGTEAAVQGSFVAPFAGLHGWYWKNPTPQPVTIHVQVEGEIASFAPLTDAVSQEHIGQETP